MEKELVKDIKDKIQFLVTIEIVFSTLVYGLFKATGVSEVISNKNASIWAIGVALCVANYILIERVNGTEILIWIRRLIYVNLICFIPLIILTALVQYNPLPDYCFWPFIISLWAGLSVPIITFLVISIVLSFSKSSH